MSVRLAPSDKGITGSVEDGANMKTQLADLRRRPTIAIATTRTIVGYCRNSANLSPVL